MDAVTIDVAAETSTDAAVEPPPVAPHLPRPPHDGPPLTEQERNTIDHLHNRLDVALVCVWYDIGRALSSRAEAEADAKASGDAEEDELPPLLEEPGAGGVPSAQLEAKEGVCWRDWPLAALQGRQRGGMGRRGAGVIYVDDPCAREEMFWRIISALHAGRRLPDLGADVDLTGVALAVGELFAYLCAHGGGRLTFAETGQAIVIGDATHRLGATRTPGVMLRGHTAVAPLQRCATCGDLHLASDLPVLRGKWPSLSAAGVAGSIAPATIASALVPPRLPSVDEAPAPAPM